MKVAKLFQELGKLMNGQKELPVTLTFEPEFNELYLSYATNPSKLKYLELEGISPDKIDVGAMSHKYFTQRLADTSIDMNANANEELSANNYQAEVTKGILKLEGYYLLWRYTKKRFGLERANEAIKAIWNGDIYFHDASGHGIQVPYSYIGDTSIYVRINGIPQLVSMDSLFDRYVANVVEAPDRQYIELFSTREKHNELVLTCKKDTLEVFKGGQWVKINQLQKHRRHNDLLAITTEDGRTTVVTQDHPVVLKDGSTRYAKDISVGDTLMTSEVLPSIEQTVYVNPQLAYLMGLYLADGHKSQYSYKVTQNEGAIFDKAVSLAEHLGYTARVDSSRPNRFALTGATEMFNNMVLGGNSFTKRLPKDISSWNAPAKIALVCGLYDGEGSLSGNSLTIRVSNFALASQVTEILKQVGVEYVSLNAREVEKSRKGFKANTNIIYCVSFVPKQEDLVLFKQYAVKLTDYNYDYANNKFANKQAVGVVKKVITLKTGLGMHDYVYDISVDGELFYSNGLIQHNCFAFSTTPIMNEGRPYGQLHSVAPKRSDSFVAQVIEVCMDLSQEFAGAVAPSDFLVNLSYYLKKEGVDPDSKEGADYIINLWQKFVHVMNNKFRVSGQSPFTNISVFDRHNIKTIFEHTFFPDGTQVDVEYVMKVQKLCADWFSKGDPATQLPYRFPVMTSNMSVDENRDVLDEDFLKFVAKTNISKGVYNIYANEGTKIAMCMSGGTEIIYRDTNGVISKSAIRNIVENFRDDLGYEVLCNGKFVPIVNVVRTRPVEGKIMNIVLQNGHSINVTLNHPSIIVDTNGNLLEVESRNLKVGDRLPISKYGYKGSDLGDFDFDLGWLVGVYTAEGNIENENKTVKFSLNITESDYADKLANIIANKFGERINVNRDEENNSMTIRCTSKVLVEFVKRFIGGTTSKSKRIKSKLFSMSEAFRQGFVIGMIDGDGHIEASGKITVHTSNRDLMIDLSNICRSLGVNTSYYSSRNTTGDKKKFAHVCSFMRILPEWLNQHYSITNGNRSCIYEDCGDFYSVAIKSIEVKDYNEDVYDIEVSSNEHLFQLANGVITHNCCRFINDMERMSYRADSFGNGGLNIGSHRIVTINFARLGMKSNTEEEFFANLDYLMLLARDLLVVHREEILGRRIKAGFLKFFNPLHWFDLKMLFSTIGINGLYEMCYFLGMPMEQEDGQKFTEKVLLKVEDYALQFTKECGYSFNTEEIPGESTAVVFAKKDRLTGICEQPFELYSNQYLPVIADVNPIERIKLSGRFMNIVSGGGIVHLNIAEQIQNPEIMEALIRMTLKAGVPHFALNYSFGVCENGHTTICGTATTCPICGGKVIDHLTRIIGYFTKVSSWNSVRKDYEFPRRKFKTVA